MGSEIKFWSKRLLVSAFLVFISYKLDLLEGLASSDIRAAANAMAQMSVTMLGFILAALAILISVANSRLIRNMQKTGHYRVLVRRLFGCLTLFGMLAIASLILLFTSVLYPSYTYPYLTLLTLSIAALCDVARKFWMVLIHLHPDSA